MPGFDGTRASQRRRIAEWLVEGKRVKRKSISTSAKRNAVRTGIRRDSPFCGFTFSAG
jgi:hypothetical protein